MICVTLGGRDCLFAAKHFSNAVSFVKNAKTVKIMFRDNIRQITMTADDGRFAILMNRVCHEETKQKHTKLGCDPVVADADYGLITDKVKAIATDKTYDDDYSDN